MTAKPLLAQPRSSRATVVASLLVFAALAWLVLAIQSNRMDEDERMLTMGMGFPLFVATWSLMMAAMMLPTASPMIDAFVRVQANNRVRGNGFVSPFAFVAGYLLVWCSIGVIAFVLARWLEDLAMDRMWLMDRSEERRV